MINENEGLKREIGVWGLVSNSINIIIGAGIFILPAIVAERLGSEGIWPYLICGILTKGTRKDTPGISDAVH